MLSLVANYHTPSAVPSSKLSLTPSSISSSTPSTVPTSMPSLKPSLESSSTPSSKQSLMHSLSFSEGFWNSKVWHLCFHFWVKKSLGRNDPLNKKLVWLKRLFYWLSIPVFNSLISDLVLCLMSFLSAQSAKVTHIGILGDSPLKKNKVCHLGLSTCSPTADM